MLRGIGGAPGIVIGTAFIFRPEELVFDRRQIAAEEVDNEIFRLHQAISQAHKELSGIYSRTLAEFGRDRSGFFQTQLMILEDPAFDTEIVRRVTEGHNVEASVGETVANFMGIYMSSKDLHMQERANDYRDVGCRLLRILLGQAWSPLPRIREKSIVVARELTTADTVQIDRDKILGFVTESGVRTSTVSILARSLEVPAVVGLGKILDQVRAGDLLVVDGSTGVVIINPDEKTLAEYRKREETYIACKNQLQTIHEMPSQTKDGTAIRLWANIDLPSEAICALANGAEGIGLMRTEHLFMGREDMPDEIEQYEYYLRVVRIMGDRPVVIRTLDFAGPNSPFFLTGAYEPNPFLGCRGIRLSFNFEQVFKTQLKSILRVSAHGNVKIMVPMISRVEELRRAKGLFKAAMEELTAEGVKFNPKMEFGMLVEVPSAALTAELFAPHIDFYSIGTNDLVQYTLAVDRRMEKINLVDQALHPAVLRLIRSIIDAGRTVDKSVAMCGEMAGEPMTTLLLLGLGLRQFSAVAGSLPEVKKIIRAVTISEAREVAINAMQLPTPEEIKQYLQDELKSRRLYF